MVDPGASVMVAWKRLHGLPGGRWLFGRLLRHLVPYTGSIAPDVRELEPGHAVVALRDRRAVRNHLDSVHAVALINLGEVTTGLAMLTALPRGQRGIVMELGSTYLKKARGRLVAEARVPPGGPLSAPEEREATAEIRNADGEAVAVVRARWRIAPAG